MVGVEQLLRDARTAHARGGYRDALRILDRIDESLANGPPSDARRGEAGVLRAELLRLAGDLQSATIVAEQVVADARAHDWPVLPDALRMLARTMLTAGDPGGAERILQHARQLFRDTGDALGEARCLRDLATVLERCGDARGARAHYDDALERFRALDNAVEQGYTLNGRGALGRQRGELAAARSDFEQALAVLAGTDDAYGRGRALEGLATVAIAQGDSDRALALAREAADLFEQLGYAGGVATCWNVVGECLRDRGELPEAEEAYRRALAAFPGLEEESIVLQVNLALVVLQRGLYDDAALMLTDLLDRLRPARQRLMAGLCELYLLPCSAAAADWEGWDAHWLRGTSLLAETGLVDRDVAICARLAGELASAHPVALGRAARAHGLALHHWRTLGNTDEADREEAALRQLAARSAPVPLGPFDLLEPLGRGSMGEVWRARHRAQDVEVAVKVLTGTVGRRFQELVHDEVRAVAALDHPHVVRVLDQGDVDRAAERMTEGRLTSGSPWVAMELASGGTLLPLCSRLPWTECKPLLLSLLDALAHAHARGVVHFDIKPANVLLDGGTPPAPRLSDFGLAGAFRSLEGKRIVLGTPGYMSPEQFHGDPRAYGPWTDLYGLGCLAWELLTGLPPFVAETVEGYRQKHIGDDPPRFRPRVAVPEGLEAWIRRLLAKDPRDRFRRAADAAWALQRLPDPPALPAPEPDSGPASLSAPTTVVLTGWDDSEPILRQDRPDLPLPDVPPVPLRWRPPVTPDPPAALIGTGLRLTALRTVPLVGREPEQDLLWAMLRDVASRQQARLVAIVGPAGVGKTRLAEWLGERAHEIGAGAVLKATPEAGVHGLVCSFLRCDGLEGKALDRRIHDALVGPTDRRLARQLATAVSGAGDPLAAAVALVDRVTVRRPAVVLLDDAVADPDLLGLAERLAAQRVPVLILLTVRDDALQRHPIEAARIDTLLDRDNSTTVPLGALDPKAHAALIRRRLWLASDLAWQLAERTEGNPRYAVQLVDDLARRDLLAPGPQGFTLYPGTAIDIPDGLLETWRRRLEELLEGLPEQAWTALTVAAAIGPKVDGALWADACALLGVEPSAALLVRLRSAELAVGRASRGWRFGQPMVRDAVLRLARDTGELPRVHRACADALTAAGRPDDPRLALHLVEAGELEAALLPLLGAATAAGRRGSVRDALDLLERREDALRSLAIPASDIRWGQQALASATCHGFAGSFAAMEREAQRAVDLARRHGWQRQLAKGLRMLADADRLAGRHAVAVTGYREGLEAAEAADYPLEAARCLFGLGAAARGRGDLHEAEQRFRAAIAAYEAAGTAPSGTYAALAATLRGRGDLDAAEQVCAQALQAAGVGDLASRCDALIGLGDVARDRGQLERAEALYKQAREAAGDATARAVLADIDLCLVDLQRFRMEPLAARLERIETLWTERAGIVRDFSELLRVAIVAIEEEPVWDRARGRAELILDHRELVDPDVAAILEATARRARAAGKPDRARWALRRARLQWQALGRDRERDRVERQLARLQDG